MSYPKLNSPALPIEDNLEFKILDFMQNLALSSPIQLCRFRP